MLPAPFHNSLVLTGPTGSGKTRLGIELAQRLDAEIISMDSMALYRGLDAGTAKPTQAERQTVRHHLVDVLEPWESASVAWWLRAATSTCRDISARGKQVLFVGGTPLYLKALMFGLFDAPPADARLRQRLHEEGATLGAAALHEQLAQRDPATAARLHPNDKRRIIRALEVVELTGRPISAWQQQWGQEAERKGEGERGRRGEGETRSLATESGLPVSSSPCLPLSPSPCLPFSPILWLDLPRPVLYDRINCRVEEMFAGGLVDEVRELRDNARPFGDQARQALGYKEVFAYLDGAASLKETITRVQTRTRNFAKRQVTWFRHLPGCQSTTPQLTETLWQPKMKK